MRINLSTRSILLCILFSRSWWFSCADVPCTTDADCQIALIEGSECVSGLCTNPFYYGGCLKRMHPDGWHKIRTCNSEDPPEAAEKGYCRPSPLGYREVRIASENWESAFFVAWIMQILLGEVMDVPTTIESGVPHINVNLYNINSSFGYGGTTDFNALRVGYEVGDCTQHKPRADGTYEPCSHVIPEYWVGYLRDGHDFLDMSDLGVLASLNWYIPKFTAVRDPTLVSYTGLAGEGNRRKLAETFRRPTNWKEYCELVSINNCATDDGVASRPPADDTEAASYFVKHHYIGHFRATEQNDCDRNPDTCTGHILDFPCGWSFSVIPQTYHFNIALESNGDDPAGGYEYSHQMQILLAANATKSDLIFLWWKPEILSQNLMGTDAEFTRVVLPPPTQLCNDNRKSESHCWSDLDRLRGNPQGACDFAPHVLNKVISKAIRDELRNVPEELWSPAYQALINMKMSDLQLGQISEYWKEPGIDEWNFDPRRAACRWVVENIERIKSFIPHSHPRTIEFENLEQSAILLVGLVFACLVLMILAVSGALARVHRRKRAILYTQEAIIYFIVGGLMLLAASAILMALPPSNGKCLTVAWSTNIGHCLVFVPLFVRLSAINTLLQSGKKMQRVNLSKRTIMTWMGAAVSLLSVFLIVWSVLDAPRKVVDYDLTNEYSSNGELIIRAMRNCSSEHDFWFVISLSWRGVLLMLSLMVAYTALMVREDINDTRALTAAVLSHMVFFFLSIVFTFFGKDSMDPVALMGYRSLTLSVECLSSLFIYVGPKIFAKEDELDVSETDPDLFIDTSIMIADITGFSAWSSVREPGQVFRFLQMIYNAFDELAEKSKVFKVETTGDCYVAATGIPRAQPDHAVMLARFASQCINKMIILTQEMEIVFGPDTSNLGLRVGIHSGPVTGGFLKGKGARFQLFGDTMNTAVHLAKSGENNRVQVSIETAERLTRGGKKEWLVERHDEVATAGKGILKTFWLIMDKTGENHELLSKSEAFGANDDMRLESVVESRHGKDEVRVQRLIDWNVEVLLQLIKQIIAKRNATTKKIDESSRSMKAPIKASTSFSAPDANGVIPVPLDEVQEIIALPAFDSKAAMRQRDVSSVTVSDDVVEQLRYFVTTISQMYHDNPFHNFSHCSHVVMAVTKFMNRINEARELENGNQVERKFHDKKFASALHDHTYGITSDPLTQFACVFSALIHDVDHPGVPNPQLAKENESLAAMYRSRSIAEQNSFDLSWNLLMDSRFNELRSILCATGEELRRFRQIVINSVMATDLGDKELKELRNGRWEKAFNGSGSEECDSRDDINRKATIVVEHLIQAADVSHTTQHWEVYRVWNENLFRELYKSYCEGRAQKNPAEFWYDGEIGFFDYYIIPLAKKLRDCGVFGLTSDENLNYAMQNRQLWVERGHGIVAEMLERARVEFGEPTN